MVSTVGSLVQWDTTNIVVTDSSRYVQIPFFFSVLALLLANIICSVVVSFEVVASSYAQQLSENETQIISSPTLTLVSELVSYITYVS